MPLTEHQAQQITLVRVLEQTQSNDALWSTDDAKEATRATIELQGSKASFAEFVARRASWVLETINKRTPNRAIHLEPSRLPLVAGQVLAVLALVCGILTDFVATSLLHPRQINIIVWSLVMLILWNQLFMAWFLVKWILQLFQRAPQKPGVLVELFGKYMSFSLRLGQRRQGPWLDNFKYDWSQLCGPITTARLKLTAHIASILFTIGAFVFMFLRFGTARYTVGWETTLDTIFTPQRVHCILSLVLAPAPFLSDRTIPDEQHIELLGMSSIKGEVAENLVWLYIWSVLAWVIIPRFYLVAVNWIAHWRMRRNFALPMKSTYFTTGSICFRCQK